MVPDKFLNSRDLSSIGNVILQGENNTDNPEIYKLGIDIYNKFSSDHEIKTTTIPIGLDNFSPTIIPLKN